MTSQQFVKILKGTTLKMLIMWDYPSDPSISLDTVDFYVEYYTSNIKQKVTLNKEDLVREEVQSEAGTVVNWYAYIQTDNLASGKLMMRLHASITDPDAPGEIKIEYTECTTNVELYG